MPFSLACLFTDLRANSANVVHSFGVALIYRDNLKAKRLKFDCAPAFECVASTLSSAAARIVFVVVYRPGNQPVRDQFFTELTSVLEAIALYSCDVVLTGDFNIHVDDDARRTSC